MTSSMLVPVMVAIGCGTANWHATGGSSSTTAETALEVASDPAVASRSAPVSALSRNVLDLMVVLPSKVADAADGRKRAFGSVMTASRSPDEGRGMGWDLLL